ncbi:MAG: DUF2971 domain-containing protein [Dysosmobacter sp.]
MIYCKTQPNMTERIAKFQDAEFTMEALRDIYFHGALRKSIDWAFQNEWRLLLPMGRKNTSDFIAWRVEARHEYFLKFFAPRAQGFPIVYCGTAFAVGRLTDGYFFCPSV